MGRRPNALLSVFFERGPKLADSSNRYVHTCKRCARVFPKGRPDSLQRHLFVQCPNITATDREEALAHASTQVSHQPAPATLQNPFVDAQNEQRSNETRRPSSPLLEHETSALDTLAEVSRQRLDSSAAFSALDEPETAATDIDRWYAQLQQQLETANGSEGRASPDANANLRPPDAGIESTSFAQSTRDQAEFENHDDSDALPRPHEGLVNVTLVQLPLDVSSVPQSDQLLVDHLQGNASLLDPQLHDHSPADPDCAQLQNGASEQSQLPSQGYGLLQRPPKKLSRTRFSDERRKQVVRVRRLGACVRCRMLKKPCSSDTPCASCLSVETARLWKTPCIRNRLVDELTLYNTALFNARSHANVNVALIGKQLQKQSGRIEASLYPNSRTSVSFNPMAALEIIDFEQDMSNASAPSSSLMIDFEGDTVTDKIERYLHDLTDEIIARDVSPFMQTTLKTATKISATQKDNLLTQVVPLWIATQALTSSMAHDWVLSYNADQAPSPLPEVTALDRQLINADSLDYSVIKGQLLDAVERYCAKQNKLVLKELERRIIARHQSSPFSTFLAAMIVLNCAERMSLLFRFLDVSLDPTPASPRDDPAFSLAQHAMVENPTAMPPHWPLDREPATYWRQGQSFAELLCSILRLRGLPPRLHLHENDAGGHLEVRTADGILASASQSAQEVNHDADSHAQSVAQWLTATGLTMSDAQAASSITETDRPGSPHAWDLRLISGLIWPEAVGSASQEGNLEARDERHIASASESYDVDVIVNHEHHEESQTAVCESQS